MFALHAVYGEEHHDAYTTTDEVDFTIADDDVWNIPQAYELVHDIMFNEFMGDDGWMRIDSVEFVRASLSADGVSEALDATFRSVFGVER